MSAVAVVGLACRFPGAPDARAFWRLLRDEREGLTRLRDDDLRRAGVDEALVADPAYVKVRGTLDAIDGFDAPFFSYTASEAALIDPQQRIFLECCWHALEDGACDPERFSGRIGVFAGAGSNTYLLHHVMPAGVYAPHRRALPILLASEKDFLASRVAYKLDLRGPALTIQTACSTSLVAVHAACQSLLSGECDLALAGGVTVRVPQDWGYLYEEGGIFSRDGHCRAWDAAATGTVDSSGAGVVVLRRYEEALQAGDPIRAIVLGSAINNDGAAKVGYAAPSADGQAEVIAEALAVARVRPRSVGYVETHGTGTPLGDPVEMEALTRAFRPGTADRAFCGIGSVKSNIGHTDAAAGVASLIKTVLSLEREWRPATLHVRAPNPRIPWAESPCRVVANGEPWPRTAEPRRAGVSSFGIGGTNVHLVLEEAPPRPASATHAPRGKYILRLSGRTPGAVEALSLALAAELEDNAALALADASCTLREGRKRFAVTRVMACADREEAIAALRQPPAAADSERAWEGPPDEIRDGRRVPLPTYPFERRRHWVAPGVSGTPGPSGPPGASGAPGARGASLPPSAPGDLWLPEWTRDVAADDMRALDGEPWAVLTAGARGDAIAIALEARGARVERVPREAASRWLESGPWTPGLRLAHAWGLDDVAGEDLLAGLLALAQAAGRAGARVETAIFTSGAVQVASEPPLRPDLALVHGAAKVVEQEIRGVRMRVVDVASPGSTEGAPDEATLAPVVAAELARPHAAEVALRGRDRWLRRLRRVTLPAGRPPRIRDGGVYLVTGGTGGIGLAIAEWLAREARDVRLVLASRRGGAALGAAERARVAAWRAMVRIEAVDVGDAAAVDALVTSVRDGWGRIDGVVHAAGVPGGGMILSRTAAQVAEVLRPKVAGTRNLAAALGGSPLDFFVVTSSVASLRGGFGRFDYAAANAWLDAWAAAAPPEWHAVAVDWAAWADTGMARASATAETVALAPRHHHPLIHGVLPADGVSTRVLTRLDPGKDWVLDEHRVAGAPVLPGVVYLELARAAAGLLGGPRTAPAMCRVRDVTFLEPLAVRDGCPVEIVTDVRRDGAASEFRIGTYETPGPGMPPLWRELARGHVEPLTGEESTTPASPRPTDVPVTEIPVADEDAAARATVTLGPHWQLPVRTWRDGNAAVAELDVPDALAAELSAFALHPSVTDLLTGFALRHFGDGTYLPIFYGTVDLLARTLPRRLVSRATCRVGENARTLSLDVRVAGDDGREVLRVEQYTLRRVGDDVIRSIADAAAARDRDTLAPEEALAALGAILRYPALRQVAVCRTDPVASPAGVPAIRASGGVAHGGPIGPATTHEELLHRAWERGLGAPAGDEDNFFELGGDSILALQVVADLRASGVSLSPADFFEAPTIRGQAALLARVPERESGAPRAGAAGAEFPLADLEPDELQRIVQRFGASVAQDRS